MTVPGHLIGGIDDRNNLVEKGEGRREKGRGGADRWGGEGTHKAQIIANFLPLEPFQPKVVAH